MDSYNLFGDDGSGMLEGLTDLGGADGFAGGSSSGVTGDSKDTTDNSYRQAYNQGTVSQESSIQKLASFGGSGGGGIPSGGQAGPASNSGPPAPDYHEYGAYPPRPRLPQPPHSALHPSHHGHPSHSYPGYHPGPDPMYTMPDHPGIGDMGVWAGNPGPNRYSPITPGFRHAYDHQQKMHQYPPQQAAGIGGLQSQNGSYLPRQPHFPQPTSQPVYGQQQNYPNYTQMHPPSASRISQHPYHQQMEVNPHQYGLPHSQQTHGAIPQHQAHPNMPGHQGPISSGIQGHPNVHLHHAGGPPLHHVSRQAPAPPSSVAPVHPVPSQIPYASPHHSVSMNYQPHHVQHPLDVNVANQYSSKPTGLESGSPQYRPPFHQISPQVSPRPQMSPRPQAPPQSSPRPVISPVKGPGASPLSSRSAVPTSVTSAPPPSSGGFASQNTLQALEQMVLPSGSDYPYQRNPASPAVGHMANTLQWNQNKVPASIHSITQIENMDHTTKPQETSSPNVLNVEANKIVSPMIIENKVMEKIQSDNDRSAEQKNTISDGIDVNTRLTTQPVDDKDNTNVINDPPMLMSHTMQASDTHTSDNDKAGDTKNQISESPKEDTKPEPKSSQAPHHSSSEHINELSTSQGTVIPSSVASISSPHSVNLQMAASQHLHNTGLLNAPVPVSKTDTLSNQYETMPVINRNQGYPNNNLQGNALQPTVSVNGSNNLPQGLNSNVSSNVTTNIPPATQQSDFKGGPPSSVINQIQPSPAQPNLSHNNMGPAMTNIPHTGIPNIMQPNLPIHNPTTTLLPQMPNTLPSNMSALPSHIPNMPPNLPMGMPMGVQNLHPGMPPQPNAMANMPHNLNPNMMMIGQNAIPHNNMPGMFNASHQQERAALQQEIQEIYCLPPSSENQEKVKCMQERLAFLQQHETSDKCNGGPGCIIQNSVYGTKMVESPQVTSTTGRGRGKGPARPRKPRAKKEKPVIASQALDQLPVSEDCVTAGTGILNNSELDISEDITNLDSSLLTADESITEKGKKPRAPRKTKERKPRAPKEPKPDTDKPVKERKKRQPRDPNAPKKKRGSKKDAAEVLADTTTSNDVLEKNKSDAKANELPKLDSVNTQNTLDPSTLNDSSVTDFDDIPVSKIAIKDLMEEAEAKRESMELEEENDSLNLSSRKKPKRRAGSSGSSKKVPPRRTPTGRRKKRGGLIPDSDGEPDDLISTPPPSPPAEGECDNKRRSARHTQRKKYTDDVVIRLSDEEYPVLAAPKGVKESKLEDVLGADFELKEKNKPEGTPKPNYIYVNTTEEDAMIVHHVLASRMGKREIIEPPPVPIVEETLVKTEPNEPAAELTDKEKETAPDPPESTDDTISEGELLKNERDIVPEEKIDPLIDETKPEEVTKPPEEPAKKIIVDVEEYYVKYRNFSYLHCEWKTEEELYKGDKRIFSKIKRFKQKQAQQNIFELLDDEPFNPDYIEVERILDVSENEDPGNQSVVKHYLVKWKSLQYEDSTWELEEDIDVDKINQFKIFSEIPPKDKWKYKKRPPADNWMQIKESPLYKGGNNLRPYQLEGLNWLLFSWYNNRNCILADEMGLGKTIQSLTFVNSVWEHGIRGPFLIIAPLSTIPNWQREFEGWTDMNVVVYHGSQQSKSMLQEYEFYFKNEKGEPIKEITKFNVLITTFEIIVTDFQELKVFNWRVCVIDEAHRLKNRNCKLLEGLRQLHLEHRVLLSGTPLQNNVNELFSLLNFLEPSQFSSSEVFLNEFGQLKSESEVVKLQALLKPMMLRRLKEDVEKTLAPKEETIIEVELTNIQKKYYRAILERNFSFLQKGTSSAANIPNLMNAMMELRKCCIHPYLLNGAEDQIQFDYKQTNGEDKEAYYKALIQSSGKMVLVDKLLPKLKSGGHRVLIFSQMVKCLDILEDYLLYRKYPFERIDGRIRGNLRQEAIDRFSKPDSDRFVFLLCTKAGGLGINLTAADTVIIYDSDWNPQNDLQAQARCHRIGQQKMVKIYRLICRNSYEREMFDKASLKLGLDKAILQSMNTQGKEAGPKQLSKKEIEDLLKKGAYGAVMDEDNAGDKFCEEDIEMILARRTQIIQMESEKGSTFSKASFASTDQRSDIDIRDPDFWNKWAKKAEIDTTEKKEDEDLIVTEPRKRTVIKRYGHDTDGPVEMSDMEGTPESEDDEEGIGLRSKRKKDKFGKKGRRYASDDYIPRHEGVAIPEEDVVYGSWTRSECFKIERGLLTFGWARWEETLDKNQFRKGWTLPVIEDCARIIVLYCLRHYKGDEKIRNFIWDLIEPCENGEVTISRNHSGLHNPVPRGRNAKKKNRVKDVPKPADLPKWEDPNHWSSAEKYDAESYLESSYKKHLFRHANKVLLRVRMMYYIKHEVIGDYANQIENGAHASALGMRMPRGVDSAPPRLWWDGECDVSLLVGTYVHGYENYLAMRSDPQLCFVDKLGPPDDAECTDIKSEERKVRSGGGDEDCTDEVSSGAGAASPAPSPPPRADDDATGGAHPWPSMQDLNTRLRRIITAYQRNYKREELKMQQRAKMERRERIDQFCRDDASQWRWTRADEESFRRTVASYGVEFDPTTKSLRWSRFRALARLDAKSDDALTDYLKAFMAMCKRQCGLSVGEAELPTRADLKAEPIGEERAIATLERIDLLRVLREEVAPHPSLEARLALCERSSDAPPWWEPSRHDKLLVLAVCKHGLGDTYHKIFCDQKLPYLECASRWYTGHKSTKKPESQKVSSDEDEDTKNQSEDSASEPRMSLRRRSKRSSHTERDDDTDALSELETLAKLGRNEEPLPANHWFSERALETRLHHIAHAVQNCEWPAGEAHKAGEGRAAAKRHIAIDVETERAKLHALLVSPRAAHCSPRERTDDASSDSSRRSTPAPPAPPPAHQRPSPAPSAAPAAAAPVDLSAPLDLSEAQDFSVGRRTPAATEPSTSATSTPSKSRLDDTLSRLMKRKNVPAPEQIVGKEKKRKKLDEIVLGLSAAKSSSSSLDSGRKSSSVVASVSVTPAAPPSTPPAQPAQKPFSVTVTSVPSPQSTPKELSSFLQQSLEQSSKGLKAALAPPKSFSHEAKVNKWLAEQANAERRRAATPRLAPDEHVPVVHRATGKRISGNKAPQLKHLAQWISENPMYDIDSKWTEGIKEHVKLPQDVRSQRHSPMQSTSSMGERKKGRPPTLDTPSSNLMSSNPHLTQSLAGLNPALLASLSAFDPKTLASTLSSLTGFDPKLLNSFDPKLLSSLSSFDPKNNPLLSSFNTMPNLLGFANLAGLGLPGLSSLDMSSLNAASTSTDSKNKSRKPSESSSASSSKASNSQFPFVFPNPNMLYPQLGLSGLNPFGMHSGISSAYDALGLLSSSLASTTSTPTLHSSSHSSSRGSVKTSSTSKSSLPSTATHSRSQKPSQQQSGQMPQILLPPDTFLLESLSKQSMNYEAMLKAEKKMLEESHEATDLSKVDKKKMQYDALRTQIPPEFAAVQEKLLKGDKKDIDISKMLLEQMASGALSASLVSAAEGKRAKEHDTKDLYEKLSKTTSEFMSKALQSDPSSTITSLTHKRTHDEMTNEPENLSVQNENPGKKAKESPDIIEAHPHTNTNDMDLEDLIAPSTVIKTGMKPSDFESSSISTSEYHGDNDDKLQTSSIVSRSHSDPADDAELSGGEGSAADNESGSLDNAGQNDEFGDPGRKSNKKKGRKSSEEGGSGPRRELRSSSNRQPNDNA